MALCGHPEVTVNEDGFTIQGSSGIFLEPTGEVYDYHKEVITTDMSCNSCGTDLH